MIAPLTPQKYKKGKEERIKKKAERMIDPVPRLVVDMKSDAWQSLSS